MVNKKNIGYIDIARSIGIIFIVIGHSGAPFTSMLYQFHVPLFFFISGFLYKENTIDNIKNYIIYKFKKLYVPFVVYQIIFIILNRFFVVLHISEMQYFAINGLKDILITMIEILSMKNAEPLLGAMWFVTCLLIVDIMFYVISRMAKGFEKKRALIIILLFSLGAFFAHNGINLPRNIDTALVSIIIFYLGNRYKAISEKILLSKRWVIISSLILYINTFVFKLNINMVQDEYTNIFLFLIGSISGIYITIYISKIIDKKYNARLLKYIGKNTFIIMALHFLAFKLVIVIQVIFYKDSINNLEKFPIYISDGGWWIIYTFSGIFIPLVIKQIVISLKRYIR